MERYGSHFTRSADSFDSTLAEMYLEAFTALSAAVWAACVAVIAARGFEDGLSAVRAAQALQSVEIIHALLRIGRSGPLLPVVVQRASR